MARSKYSIPLHFQIVITLIAGGFFGYFFPDATVYTNWIGVIFLRALNMIIIPLILCSITTGVASVGSGDNLDRILDMFRTTINVYGDTCCAVIIAKSEGETLNI